MKARKIATLIKNTPTELRGNLFAEISVELREMSQGYTSALFMNIAKEYGIK